MTDVTITSAFCKAQLICTLAVHAVRPAEANLKIAGSNGLYKSYCRGIRCEACALNDFKITDAEVEQFIKQYDINITITTITDEEK